VEQSFSGPINGDVAGRDVVNQIITDNVRLLTRQERIELNNKVNYLADTFAEDARSTWRYLHKVMGVESVEEFRLDHRDALTAIVDLLTERARLTTELGRALAASPEDKKGLDAKLKESQRLRLWAEGQLKETAAALIQERALVTRLQGEVEALAKKADGMMDRNRQEIEGHRKAVKRANRNLPMAMLFMGTTGASSWYAHGQAQQVKEGAVAASLCWSAGKAYSPGSVIDASPDQECVRSGDGKAAWLPVVTKKKPSSRRRDAAT